MASVHAEEALPGKRYCLVPHGFWYEKVSDPDEVARGVRNQPNRSKAESYLLLRMDAGGVLFRRAGRRAMPETLVVFHERVPLLEVA